MRSPDDFVLPEMNQEKDKVNSTSLRSGLISGKKEVCYFDFVVAKIDQPVGKARKAKFK